MRGYRITREMFLCAKSARQLLRVCARRAKAEHGINQKVWTNRYLVAHLALNSGLRVSEIAALTMGDLMLNDAEALLIVRNGKGGRKRDVYLDRKIAQHLQHYISLKRAQWQEPVNEEAPLLCGRGGGHYTTTALHIGFKKSLEEARLPLSHTIHHCRHTYATMLLAKTNNIRFVQKQLGHASMSMTASYADILPEHNQALANAILK